MTGRPETRRSRGSGSEPDNVARSPGASGRCVVGAVLLVLMVLLAPTVAPEQIVVERTGRR